MSLVKIRVMLLLLIEKDICAFCSGPMVSHAGKYSAEESPPILESHPWIYFLSWNQDCALRSRSTQHALMMCKYTWVKAVVVGSMHCSSS